jgi:hypothetical protein
MRACAFLRGHLARLEVAAGTRALLLAASLCAQAGMGHAASGSLAFCDRASSLTARQQDRLLSFAAIVRQELEASGQAAALIARSGLDLRRFGLRYSHAGISLRASENTPWSVRQLYYACEERRPRLFDQGLAGFVSGTDDPAVGYVSIVLMPAEAALPVERAALDKPRALRLLAGTYSANANPFSLRYQNCNQWVAELLATAWGDLADGTDLRARAQSWLAEQRYDPAPVEVGSHLLMFAGQFIPWIKFDDHSEEDRFALHFRVSLPTSIEAFVRERVPGAHRVELCHDERQVVIRRGWQAVAEGCLPEPGDEVIVFD